VKTKNVPNVLKCKINLNFFSHNYGVPKRGGGGVPHLGKIPTFSRFFWGGASLKYMLRQRRDHKSSDTWSDHSGASVDMNHAIEEGPEEEIGEHLPEEPIGEECLS